MSLPLRIPLRRCLGPLTAALVMIVVFAPAAAADGVGPTNYRSRIDRIEPKVPGATVKVLGSDSFVEVTAKPGVTVQIPGYEGEPYLRIDANGSVWRNGSSPATFLNNSRSGRAAIPRDLPEASITDWKKLSNDGSVAWHDHRIHWMSDETPPTAEQGLVQPWEVPLEVNGVDAVVHGSLYHSGNLIPWPALITIASAGAIFILVARRKHHIVAPVLAVASVVAFTTIALVRLADPPDSGSSPIPLILAGLALLVSVLALAPGERPLMFRLATTLGAAALLVGWTVQLVGVFWMPYVPASVPGFVIRIATALVVGAVVGSAAAVLSDPSTVTGVGSNLKEVRESEA